MTKLRTLATITILSLATAAPALAGEGMKMDRHMVGDIAIAAPFFRATLPNQPVAGGFMQVTNTGATDDRLLGGSAAIATKVEVHEMAMQDDVMRMRELEDGLIIPAGATVDLAPGGIHMMFMGLEEALVEGTRVDVTLEFENAGTVTLPFLVRSKGAKSTHKMN